MKMNTILNRPELTPTLMGSEFNLAKTNTAKSQNIEELEGAASQFESILLKMFLDQARQSKLDDDLLGSSASDNFQEMFDNELSQSGGSSMHLGLTDVIVRQLRTDLVK
tara:strand:+ start:65 stop:391 length:327 start_codon:yes stop_codon:yes gene_type:complete